MEQNTMLAIVGLSRSISAISAVIGATFLAYHDKEGWGWLVCTAILLGCFSVLDSD